MSTPNAPLFIASSVASGSSPSFFVPNGTQNSDFMIALIGGPNANTASVAGWNELDTLTTGSAGSGYLRVLTRSASAEPPSYTVSGGGSVRVVIVSYRYCSGVDARASGVAATSPTSAPAPSTLCTGDLSTLVYVARAPGTTWVSPPAGYIARGGGTQILVAEATTSINSGPTAAAVTTAPGNVWGLGYHLVLRSSAADPASDFAFGEVGQAERTWNRSRLNYRIANDIMPLPPGLIQVDVNGVDVPVQPNRTVRGTNRSTTVLDVYPKRPGGVFHLFNLSGVNGPIAFSDLTIHGPTDISPLGSDVNLRNSDLIFRQSNGDITVDRVTFTGRAGSVIEFSGLGNLTVRDCILSGYVEAIARWDSTDNANPGQTLVVGSTLSCVNGHANSIGVYIHPHIPITVQNTKFSDFNRYGVYQNGGTHADADALIEDCIFERCDVIQVGEHSTATLNRIVWRYWRDGPGSPIRGNIVVNNSEIRNGSWTTLLDGTHSIEFNNTFFRFPGGYQFLCSWGDVDMRLLDCTWEFTNLGGKIMQLGPEVNGTVTLTGVVNDVATSGSAVKILGDVTLDISGLTVNTARPETFWELGPNVTVINDPPVWYQVEWNKFNESAYNRIDGRHRTEAEAVAAMNSIISTYAQDLQLARTVRLERTLITQAVMP